jgi:retinol dehydrogenase-12
MAVGLGSLQDKSYEIFGGATMCPRLRVKTAAEIAKAKARSVPAFVMTGGTSGIGRACCESLVRRGHRLIVVARNATKGRELIDHLAAFHSNANVDLVLADLASLTSVDLAATEIARRAPRLRGLILNAAVVTDRRELTVDGLERQFAVNHLAGFLLATRLVRALCLAAPSRVVVVSSNAAHEGAIDLEDLSSPGAYSPTQTYATTKLENILFTRALSRRLESVGVTVNALTPGTVRTALLDAWERNRNRQSSIARRMVAPLRRMAGRVKRSVLGTPPQPSYLDTLEEAAERVLYLATSPQVDGVTGAYFDKNVAVEGPLLGQDFDLAEALWDRSARLVAMKIGELDCTRTVSPGSRASMSVATAGVSRGQRWSSMYSPPPATS